MSKSTHDNTDSAPATKRESYRQIKDNDEDKSLRRRVAAAIALEPATTSELSGRFAERSANAIRPRVNELLRMGCVERTGTKENPSGHEAYIHELTPTGRRYLEGEVDPDPTPPLSELKTDVVDVARAYCAGLADESELSEAVKSHDGVKLRRNPDWSPPQVLGESAATDGGTESDVSEREAEGLAQSYQREIEATNHDDAETPGEVVEQVSHDEPGESDDGIDDDGEEIPDELTREEYEKIQEDPFLEVSDVLGGDNE